MKNAALLRGTYMIIVMSIVPATVVVVAVSTVSTMVIHINMCITVSVINRGSTVHQCHQTHSDLYQPITNRIAYQQEIRQKPIYNRLNRRAWRMITWRNCENSKHLTNPQTNAYLQSIHRRTDFCFLLIFLQSFVSQRAQKQLSNSNRTVWCLLKNWWIHSEWRMFIKALSQSPHYCWSGIER